jgi:predicted membrane metal-binding protein
LSPKHTDKHCGNIAVSDWCLSVDHLLLLCPSLFFSCLYLGTCGSPALSIGLWRQWTESLNESLPLSHTVIFFLELPSTSIAITHLSYILFLYRLFDNSRNQMWRQLAWGARQFGL